MNNPRLQNFSTVVVAAAILECQGKFLLTRRRLDVHQGGLWEFPGGKQEVGETLEQCLQRELQEELDIEVADIQLFYNLRHRYPEKEVELYFFTCSIVQGEPKPLGSLGIAWVPKQELALYDFPEADLPVLRIILQDKLEPMP